MDASSPTSATFPPVPADDGSSEAEVDHTDTPKKSGSGNNLGWCQAELLALAETAPTTLEDAAVCSGQTAVGDTA